MGIIAEYSEMEKSMGIIKVEAVSPEMKKNIKVVKSMSGRMGFDENIGKVNWKAVRFISNLGYRFMPKEKDVSFTKTKLNNIKSVTAVPKEMNNDNIILYIHGGGFVSGSASASKGYCSMLAEYFKSKVYAIDYSLAPEKPYPYGVNDCFEAYSCIVKNNPDSSVVLVGESAGANLCLVTALKAMKEKILKPLCVIVHSPITDFTGSLERNNEINDITVKEGCLKPLTQMYALNNDTRHFEISPIFGDYKDFPPLIITCDENETLYADSKALYEKAEENNVDVNMYQFKNTFHGVGTLGTGSPETKRLLEENAEYVKN